MIKFNNSWDKVLSPLLSSQNYQNIREFLKQAYFSGVVYPDMHDIFNAFKLTDYNDIKVVILGQDPYHEKGQAQGLSFSVPDNFPFPPSLKNIFKELQTDLNITPPESGNLTKWAKQGVLLLNTVLTVYEGKPNSHKDCGWQEFTDGVISLINQKETPVVFILWGANAKSKKALITNPKHHIIESTHPSPFSCRNGFFGSKPFSRANDFLKSVNIPPIEWDLSK